MIDKYQVRAYEQLYINKFKKKIINKYDAVRFHKKEKVNEAILALKEKRTLLDLIKKYPNDADLGENVRKIYNK